MDDQKRQQDEITKFIKAAKGDSVGVKELGQVAKAIIAIIKEVKISLSKDISNAENVFIKSIRDIQSSINSFKAEISDKVSENISPEVKKSLKDLSDELGRVEDRIPKEVDLSLIEKRIEEISREFEKQILKIPEEIGAEKIRDKLESLKKENSLGAKATWVEFAKKDLETFLEEEFDKLRNLIKRNSGVSGIVYVGGGASGGGKVVKSYDLTSQLNGVLKTFSLPAFYQIISVQSTSFPNAFRPTVDYTSNAGAGTITFTSEISASATLNTGQTLIVIYSEA